MSDLARVRSAESGSAVVAAVEGEVDVSNAEHVGQQLAEAVSNTVTGLVIDLRELTYIDSAGVRALYQLIERLERRGQRICLVVEAEANVERVLDLTGLTTAAPVERSVERALERLSGVG